MGRVSLMLAQASLCALLAMSGRKTHDPPVLAAMLIFLGALLKFGCVWGIDQDDDCIRPFVETLFHPPPLVPQYSEKRAIPTARELSELAMSLYQSSRGGLEPSHSRALMGLCVVPQCGVLAASRLYSQSRGGYLEYHHVLRNCGLVTLVWMCIWFELGHHFDYALACWLGASVIIGSNVPKRMESIVVALAQMSAAAYTVSVLCKENCPSVIGCPSSGAPVKCTVLSFICSTVHHHRQWQYWGFICAVGCLAAVIFLPAAPELWSEALVQWVPVADSLNFFFGFLTTFGGGIQGGLALVASLHCAIAIFSAKI